MILYMRRNKMTGAYINGKHIKVYGRVDVERTISSFTERDLRQFVKECEGTNQLSSLCINVRTGQLNYNKYDACDIMIAQYDDLWGNGTYTKVTESEINAQLDKVYKLPSIMSI